MERWVGVIFTWHVFPLTSSSTGMRITTSSKVYVQTYLSVVPPFPTGGFSLSSFFSPSSPSFFSSFVSSLFSSFFISSFGGSGFFTSGTFSSTFFGDSYFYSAFFFASYSYFLFSSL